MLVGIYEFHFGGTILATENLELEVSFIKSHISKKTQKKILQKLVDNEFRKMVDIGQIKFLSPTDISKIYGNSRQYWESLMKEGKLYYCKTSSGKITTNLWIEEYINQSSIVNYPSMVLAMRNRIFENEKSSEKFKIVMCVKCDKNFEYEYRDNEILGTCDCGFQLRTMK